MKKKIGKFILVFIMLCISLGLILYPYISNYLFENRADGIIEIVEKTAEDADKDEYAKEIEAAKKYNESLLNGHIQLKDPFVEEEMEEDSKEYNSLLNMTDDGVMGFIKIPCIDVSLPIYHGTSEETLETGTGHLQGTSLPIGGESTHSVITGHTGLSSAKLFTDLTELEEGDLFFLHVMGEKLAYKVDQITKVLPAELDNLQIVPGKDYCTLVTCTPYGVNTHRLLVRGERTEYVEEKEEEAKTEKKNTSSQWQKEYAKSIILSAGIMVVLLILLLIFRTVTQKRRRKKRHKKRQPDKTSSKKKKPQASEAKPRTKKTKSPPPATEHKKAVNCKSGTQHAEGMRSIKKKKSPG